MNFVENVSIAYSDVFDDYESVKIKDLLHEIPSKNILEALAYFMAQTHVKPADGSSQQIELLKMWTNKLPQNVINRVVFFIARLQSNKVAVQFNYINNVSVLALTEHVFENYNTIPMVDDFSAEQELSLFMAYLWCSENWTRKQEKARKIRDAKDVGAWAELLITIQFPFAELTEWKHFAPQFIKAGYFFAFCEQHPVFSEYLKTFLSEQNLQTPDEYMVNLFSLYNRKFHELKTPYKLYVSNDDSGVLNFLRQLSLNISTFKRTDDFKSIREKPVFEIEPNTFLFLNLNFLVDKFFQGIQFVMATALIKNNAQYNKKPITRFDQYKSIYAQEFSERIMFYSVIRFLFEKTGYKLLAGETMKQTLKNGEPDFYVRDKGKIYLFEYKDIIIDAATKHSVDFEKIKAKLFERVVSNQDDDSKGVTQLVNTIEKIYAGEFDEVDSIKPQETIIYPIIVCTDPVLSVGGVNYILNLEFRRLLKDRRIPDGNIKSLIVIDFDTFVKYQDLFNNKSLKINNCLNEYLAEISEKKNTPFNRLMPFSLYLNGKSMNLPNRVPASLFELARKLFKFS